MHRFYFSRLGLCDEASEAVTATTSGAPTEGEKQEAANKQEQTKEPGAQNAPPAGGEVKADTPPAAPVAPSFLDTAKSLLKPKADLQAANRQLTADNGVLRAQVAQLNAELGTVRGQLDALKQERAQLQALFDQAQAEKVDVQTAVTHELASQGVPPKALPGQVAAGASSEETLEELNTRLQGATDPGERGKIAAQMKALREKANKQGTGKN
jgi:hypothetical protein